MPLIEELKKLSGLYATNPQCGHTFLLSRAKLFDATKFLPPEALQYLREKKEALRRMDRDLRSRRKRATIDSERGAASSIIGKVVERIAPSLPGFPVESRDCRALFEPIDYVVFHGLASGGKVDSISFVDVKYRGSQLTKPQKRIKMLVEQGKVSLKVTHWAKEVI